ncbi:MAG TPA: phasin family protein [Chthoniobacterales bacterium]|jgi:phasin|nr:phasin family protein [Chthoniobacterales bacterium]
MTETNTTAAGTKSAGAPKMGTPQALREMADKGTAQAKASYDKMSAATAEASSVLKNAGATAAQGFKDGNAKVIEFARTNSNAAFDFANELLAVKSPSEFIQLSTEQARKQFEVLSEQAKELTALSQKVMLETAEPLKAGAAKAFASSHT